MFVTLLSFQNDFQLSDPAIKRFSAILGLYTCSQAS